MLPIDDACHKGFYKPESLSRAKRLAMFLDINIPYQLYARPISVPVVVVQSQVGLVASADTFYGDLQKLVSFVPFPWSWPADPARAAKYTVSAAVLTF
jgi:hypothetical protein